MTRKISDLDVLTNALREYGSGLSDIGCRMNAKAIIVSGALATIRASAQCEVVTSVKRAVASRCKNSPDNGEHTCCDWYRDAEHLWCTPCRVRSALVPFPAAADPHLSEGSDRK